MYVQGPGQKINLPFDGSPRRRIKSSEKTTDDSMVSKDNTQISTSPSIRPELLEKVRNKIKSGFYNSECVLDDLSQSFAKVLDQTV